MADLSGRILGDYLLRAKIGGGGYGDVYRAEHRLLQRVAVVKVLHEKLQGRQDAKVRFVREAQLASQLRHPYAAHIYEVGVADEDGRLWIAMEFVDGVTLADWIAQHGSMSFEEFVPFFECMAEAVHAAHAAEIVHRDLKPSNVMVTELEGRRIPKLLDFGIAKGKVAPLVEDDETIDASGGAKPVAVLVQATDRITHTGSGVGSRSYMSPEQWGNASDVGPAADIYSLGILIYETLTGRLPFPATSIDDFFLYHSQVSVPALGPDFSPDLDRVLAKALDKVPSHRHGTALELAADLRAVLQADPREQLRSLARRWQERKRSPDLLARGQVLKDVERYAHRVGEAALSESECAFVASSQQLARRIRWLLGSLVVLAALVVAGFAAMQLRSARQLADATRTRSDLDQGRSALLHGEPEALPHLAEAYYRGERSKSTEFMLARAAQPRLAEQARFTSTFGRMWSAMFSPDGHQIVTTDDRAAQVWDAQTYQRTSVLFHGDTVYHALYSADGARIVTAGGDGTVKIWDAATGALVRELQTGGPPLRYFLVALSPDGRLVAAIDTKGDVTHVWGVDTGALVAEIRSDGREFPSLAFSRDGRWLAATGGVDVHVIDAQTWTEVATIRDPRVRSLAFDPARAHLVTGDTTGEVALWDIPTGVRIRRLREAGASVHAVAYSPDGQLVAAGSHDGTVQVWHGESGELQSQLNTRHDKVLAVEFDRASRFVLAVGVDGAVVAEAAEGMPIAVLDGLRSLLVAHFDPEAHRVVGASLDGAAQVWDATPPYRRWNSPPITDNCGLAPSATSDGRFVAVGCQDHLTRVWDTARDQLLAELPTTTLIGDAPSAAPAVSSAGDCVAIARGSAVEVYELPGGRLVRSVAHDAPVSAVAFATTGRDIVSGAIDGSLIVARDGGARIALPAASAGIDAVGFLVDGRIVATDAQRRLRVFDPSGVALANLEIPTRIASLRIQGARLVGVPYSESTAPSLLVDLERDRVVAQLEGYTGRLLSARWTAGGQILTAGTDGTARLWDGTTGRLVQTYRGSSRFLADATLVSDDLVVAGGADGWLRFWDKTSGYLLWALPAHASPIYGVHAESGDLVTRGITGELTRWTLPNPERVIQACGDHAGCAILEP